MKKKILTFFAFVVLGWWVFSPFLIRTIKAADTDTVDATVTAVIYSVTVTDGSVAFLTVAQNSTKDTTTSGVNDSQLASNDGSTAEKLNIKAANSTGGAGWTLAGTAGSETYTMKSCTSNCDSAPTWTSVGIDPSYATLTASLAVGVTFPFDLQVGTPTSTTETTQQSITVTIQAVAP